jgi:hypothetical protein
MTSHTRESQAGEISRMCLIKCFIQLLPILLAVHQRIIFNHLRKAEVGERPLYASLSRVLLNSSGQDNLDEKVISINS